MATTGHTRTILNESYLQQFLHERMVQEWMCNSEQYQSFLTVDHVAEAESYMVVVCSQES